MKKAIQKKEPLKPQKQLTKTVEPNKWYGAIGSIIILLLGVIIYSNSLSCSFSFDDIKNIVNNPSIRDISDVKAWWNYHPTRPLGFLSLALSYHFSELDVTYYHVMNVVIHLVTTGLVGWLTLLLLSTPVMKETALGKDKNVIAFFTALLFVSHPLATESVTYIVQRFAAIVTLFYLLSIALYLTGRLSTKSKVWSYLLYTGAFLSAVAAMLTKENAFTLPLTILLIEMFFLHPGKFTINFKDFRIILLLLAFLGAVIIIPLKSSISVFKPIPAGELNDYTITPLNYLLTQFSVIVKYIQLLFLPLNQNLDYDYPVSNSFFEVITLLSFVLLVSLVGVAIFLFKRYRIISFGIFWFFLTLSIESSIVPINDVIFEHRTYLPSFGFFLMLCYGIYILLWDRYKYVAIGVLLLIAAFNSVLTYERNKVWKDELTLWGDAALKSPNKSRPFVNLGLAYLGMGQLEKAETNYSRAIENNPKRAIAWYSRGVVYSQLELWDKAASDYTHTIEINPKHKEAHCARGYAYSKTGRYEEAVSDFNKAMEIDSQFAKAYYDRGVVFNNLKRYDEGVKDFTRVIELDPVYAEAYVNRGNIFRDQGNRDAAMQDYGKAIELQPGLAIAYFNRGTLFMNEKQTGEAISNFSRAIQLDGNYFKAYNNRGIVYYNEKRYEEANSDFTKAIALKGNYADAYYNRALSEYYSAKIDAACADLNKAAGLGYQRASDVLRQICN